MVSEMTEDADGNIWIASQSGLYIVNLKEDQVESRLFSPPSLDFERDTSSQFQPSALLTDRDGTVWIGTSQGIYCYNPRSKSIFGPSDFKGLPHTMIQDIEIDRIGHIAEFSPGTRRPEDVLRAHCSPVGKNNRLSAL